MNSVSTVVVVVVVIAVAFIYFHSLSKVTQCRAKTIVVGVIVNVVVAFAIVVVRYSKLLQFFINFLFCFTSDLLVAVVEMFATYLIVVFLICFTIVVAGKAYYCY